MTFRETCYELRRVGNLYASDAISRQAWCAAVHRALAAWKRSA